MDQIQRTGIRVIEQPGGDVQHLRRQWHLAVVDVAAGR